MHFIIELKKRNPTLFWYGVLNVIGVITCLLLVPTTHIEVNGINAFIKPMKFFLSIWLFMWTMGWLMFYLQNPGKVRAYNIMTVIVFSFEIFVITWQAANGRLSHFNITTPLYSSLFSLMGIAITVLTLWTAYIGYLFFKKRDWILPMSYVWAIRLGILFFVVFALEGGVMGAILRHTVGGEDSDKGIIMLNWNRQHGDLRVAHFLGMHTLQLFPLVGFYILKRTKPVIIFCLVYFVIVVAILVQALMGIPFL